jgi:hypothetical protein
MSEVLWVAALLFLIWPGLIAWRLPLVARLDVAARLSIAFACGIAIVGVLLYAYDLAHVPWTRITVGVPLLVLGFFGVIGGQAILPVRTGRIACPPILLFAILTIYGVATARETCGDLIYFWGPKAARFHYAGKIDAAFLGFPHYSLMHSDYPPMLPLTYAWPSLIAHRFSWWGPLFLTPIALLATAFAFCGLTRNGWLAILLTAILGYGFAIGMVAGAADPPLLMFEVIAIAALTFAGDDRDGQLIGAIALAAAAFTKVEGAAFAILTILAFLIVTRTVARTLLLAMPSVVLLGSWIVFCDRHHLLDAYGNAKSAMHFELLRLTLTRTLQRASYGVAYVPWIAALAPLAIRRRLRRAALPLLVAAGSIASTIFFYLHSDNPSWWIASSAMRVLLTPLTCLVVASAAASE